MIVTACNSCNYYKHLSLERYSLFQWKTAAFESLLSYKSFYDLKL
jgi:hypothetical protein